MKQSIKTLAAASTTLVLVAASLLIPGELMAKEDRRNNGIVQASDQVYYTGVLDTYLGDESFYNRLMLMTGRWESEEKSFEAYIIEMDPEEEVKSQIITAGEMTDWAAGYKAEDNISRLSLNYWDKESGTENRLDSFFYQGNSIRALCNLTAFEMMPFIFSPYYQSWQVERAEVYRYTDSYFKKYKCDMALIYFVSNWSPWAEGRFLVDVESGDYTGFWLYYEDTEYYLSVLREIVMLGDQSTEGEDDLWLKDWLTLFIEGETVTQEDGSTVQTPLSEAREEKARLNQNLISFMDRIDFEQVEPITDPVQIQEIPKIPMFDRTVSLQGHLISEPLVYAWSVTERSTQKKFYFVISSQEGSFQAYFSPMPEKTAENNLTDR